MKLYALLVKELSKQHKIGQRGLILRISLKSILRLLSFHESGENVSRIKRQLNRLTRASLDFKNSKGKVWMGPLLTEVLMEGEGRSALLSIAFSHFMITFYRLHEYTSFDKDKLWALGGDSSTLFLFYSSHSTREMTISIERGRQLLAIGPEVKKDIVLRRFRLALKKMIMPGLMDPKKTFIKNGNIHTCLITQ